MQEKNNKQDKIAGIVFAVLAILGIGLVLLIGSIFFARERIIYDNNQYRSFPLPTQTQVQVVPSDVVIDPLNDTAGDVGQ